MEQERLLKAMELFEVPEKFYEVSQLMVEEAEWELILLMGKNIIFESELKKMILEHKLACDPYDFIYRCYHRAILNKKPGGGDGVDSHQSLEGQDLKGPEGEMAWQISDFYCRYPYYAQYEYYAYGKLPREMKEALNAWDLEVYLSYYSDDVKKKMQGIDTHVHNSDFLTLEEAYAFVDKNKDHIHVYACNCKAMMYYHDRPVAVCMGFYDGPNSEADRGHGEKLTAEQAKAKLKEFNKKGLMQNGEDYGLCNCDGFACYPLQMARTLGSQGIYPKSNYDIDWHEDECVNCGKCTTICNFQAFTKDENKKVHYNKDLCWGCTICAPNCPKGAIHLIPKKK